MRTTIDSAGRIIIPKLIRQQAGLKPGTPLDVRWQDGRIEIEPVTLPIKLVRDGPFLVARAEAEVPPLTTAMVEETIEALRNERGSLS